MSIGVEQYAQNVRKKGMVKIEPNIEEVIACEPNIVIDRGTIQATYADGQIKLNGKFVLHFNYIYIELLELDTLTT